MILIILTALLAFAAFAAAGLEAAIAGPLAAAMGAALALAVLAAPRARNLMWRLMARQALALTTFAAALAALLWHEGIFHAASRPEALRAGVTLIGLALAAPAAAGVAAAYGRASLAMALLIGAIALAFLALFANEHDLAGPLGRLAPALDSPALAAGFGLVSLLALHVTADELRRRPAPGHAALPPLAQRLFAPVAALMTSFAMLALAGATAALTAAAVAGLVFTVALWTRARRSRVGTALLPALLFVSIGAAALAVVSASIAANQRPLVAEPDSIGAAAWLTQAGLFGAGLAALGYCTLVITLAMSKDRNRTPSRGAPLLGAAGVFAATVSTFATGMAAPAAGLLLAVLTGLAASYVDLSSARSQNPN
ncbi:MAG: hypothetical protein AB7L65_06710 [Hyphomonadaceae bacterium]